MYQFVFLTYLETLHDIIKIMKSDMRKQKTKAALKNAFIDLLKDTKAERITVTQLTNKARVGRVTFYLHFIDMPDLIDKISEEMFAKVVLLSEADVDIFNLENSRMVYIKQLYAILEVADTMTALLGPNGPPDFRNQLALLIKNEFYRRLQSYENIINDQVDMEMLIDYITQGEIVILTGWLARGRKETPEELVENLLSLTYHGIFKSLGLMNTN